MEVIERQQCQASIHAKIACYCCDLHYDLCFSTSSAFLKSYGSCCHFSFVNNQRERRNCATLNISQALLSN